MLAPLQQLSSAEIIRGTRTEIDRSALGFDMTVLVMIHIPQHSKEWADQFRAHMTRLPEMTDLRRSGGDWDYLVKMTAWGIAGYDAFNQKLIADLDLATVTGLFSMEPILHNRALESGRFMACPYEVVRFQS